MNLKELKEKKATELASIAKDLGVENASGMRKQDLVFAERSLKSISILSC